MTEPRRRPRVDVLGVEVSDVDMEAALDQIGEWIRQRVPSYVCVTGVHGVMESQRDGELRRIHNRSGMTVPDGMPLVWAGRFAGARDIDRVCGPELLPAAAERAARERWRLYFYGGGPGVGELLTTALAGRFPGLIVAGTYSPPFRDLTAAEDEEIVRRINDADPDIVWVGLSTPKQERWMAAHVGRLTAPVLVGVGAAFDMHAGLLPRAPRWLRRTGMEWVYRMYREPRRLARRYLVNNPRFIASIIRRPPRRAVIAPADLGT